MSNTEPRHLPAPVIALAGWLLPGLGYFLIGQRARGFIAGAAILLTFIGGIFIGGIRVIDVPGYDINGAHRVDRDGKWLLTESFASELMYKPWYIAQSLTGPINIAATWLSLDVAPKTKMSTARIFDIGTLYTAVAGMLNLLVIIDAAYRSTHPPAPEPTGVPAPDAQPDPALGASATAGNQEGAA